MAIMRLDELITWFMTRSSIIILSYLTGDNNSFYLGITILLLSMKSEPVLQFCNKFVS